MTKHIQKQCCECQVVSRWCYVVRIPKLYKTSVTLCDDCLLKAYHEVKKVDVLQ
jgi:hypothetical protein